VAEGEELLRRLIGSQIEFRLEHGPGAKWVRVDRAQLQQVLLNLCINARDAMQEGGWLKVSTAVEAAPEGASAPAGSAVLVVEDNGVGIPAEHLPHIFEPFFTTKEVGQGTGLGLATVHGIVAQSGGQITAQSEPGRGTRFTVRFPITSSPAGVAAPTDRALPARPPRAALLLVEDEEPVRTILARTLRDEGYEVLEARHGREALTRLHERTDIRLVLTDLVMPVMNGRVLGEQLAREQPGLPLVWMSGYPRDTAFADGTGAAEHPFLQKPIDPDLLIRTVGQAVHGAETR